MQSKCSEDTSKEREELLKLKESKVDPNKAVINQSNEEKPEIRMKDEYENFFGDEKAVLTKQDN